MKREYFIMLYMIFILAIMFIATFLIKEDIFFHHLNKFIIVWIVLSVYVGQYSMKFPKRF